MASKGTTAFINKTLIALRFQVYETTNRAKHACTTCKYNICIKATKQMKQREKAAADNVLRLSKNVANVIF